jgi:[ribosomal protein S5]-alanine N-acetyltransferase
MSVIRPLVEGDAQALLALRLQNREFMQPFDPVRPEDFFTLDRQRELARNEAGTTFAILDGTEVAGTIALSNVARGPFQSANVGYGVSENRNGRGLASRALAAVDHAFGELGLNRLEAGTLVDNVGSQRVLEKNGFERIGLARNYLEIAGARRDHIMFQRIAD